MECKECRVVICEDDSYEVIDKGESINYEFCSMTCIEKFFFPGSTIDLKERDILIREQKDSIIGRDAVIAQQEKEIAELKAMIEFISCGVWSFTEIQEAMKEETNRIKGKQGDE
jgi:hypothetical protein